ncbi:MAG TPA: hypothetical protein VIO60_04995 [Rectinemataceae bacterium]
MELQVKELLDRIQSEGVQAAEKRAHDIIAQAEERARAIMAEAEAKAAAAESQAKERIEQAERASRLALQQASRDTILALRQRVEAFLNAALVSSTKEALDAGFISRILPGILGAMASSSSTDLSVLLPPAILQAFDDGLAARLSKELGKKVVFKPFAGLDAGFRVASEGSAAQVDFSAEAVAELLGSRVNARLAECLRSSLALDSAP